MTLPTRFLLIITFSFYILCFPLPIFAHATPVITSPTDASILTEPPQKISITFNERLEPEASHFIIYDPDGQEISLMNTTVLTSDPYTLETTVETEKTGTYSVTWRVLSADDGHVTRGAFVFAYGDSTIITSDSPYRLGYETESSTFWWEALTIFTELIGYVMLTSVALMRSFFGKVKSRINSQKLVKMGLLCVIIGTVANIGIQMYQLYSPELQSFSQIFQIVLKTNVGSLTITRTAIGIIALLLSFKLSSSWYIFLIVVCLTYFRAKVSHASASHFLPTFSVMVNTLHLFFKDLWVSAVLVNVLLLKNFKVTNRLLVNYLTNISLIIGGVTGTYIVWLHLKSVDNLLTTTWGQRMTFMTMIAGVMLALRLWHHAGEFFARLNKKYLRWYTYTIRAELLAGVIVILMTSVLIITTPPVINQQVLFESTQKVGKLELSVNPQYPDKFVAKIEPHTNQPILNLTVVARNIDARVGPLIVNTQPVSNTAYLFSHTDLHPQGSWTLEFTAQLAVGFDLVETVTIDTKDINPSTRKFDLFSLGAIVTAVILAIFGGSLLRQNIGKMTQSKD